MAQAAEPVGHRRNHFLHGSGPLAINLVEEWIHLLLAHRSLRIGPGRPVVGWLFQPNEYLDGLVRRCLSQPFCEGRVKPTISGGVGGALLGLHLLYVYYLSIPVQGNSMDVAGAPIKELEGENALAEEPELRGSRVGQLQVLCWHALALRHHLQGEVWQTVGGNETRMGNTLKGLPRPSYDWRDPRHEYRQYGYGPSVMAKGAFSQSNPPIVLDRYHVQRPSGYALAVLGRGHGNPSPRGRSVPPYKCLTGRGAAR